MKALYESILDSDFDINDKDVFVNMLKSKKWYASYSVGFNGSHDTIKRGHSMFFDDILNMLKPTGHKLKDIDECIDKAEDGEFMMAINEKTQIIYLFWQYKYSRKEGPIYAMISISIILPESENRALQVIIQHKVPEHLVPPINQEFVFNVKGAPEYYTVSRKDFMKFESIFEQL